MINKPPPFKGLKIRIPIIVPIRGRGFINQGSGVVIGEGGNANMLANHQAEKGPRYRAILMAAP